MTVLSVDHMVTFSLRSVAANVCTELCSPHWSLGLYYLYSVYHVGIVFPITSPKGRAFCGFSLRPDGNHQTLLTVWYRLPGNSPSACQHKAALSSHTFLVLTGINAIQVHFYFSKTAQANSRYAVSEPHP